MKLWINNLPLIKLVSNKYSNNRILLNNFSALTLLQISNYIFPLITLPYLVRVLGPYNFGLVNFVIAFGNYFVILTQYGFNLSATQKIAQKRDDKNEIDKIFSSIFFIKIILFILSGIIYSLVVYLVPDFYLNRNLFFAGYIFVLGSVLFPQYIFMGLEKMKYITILNISGKILTTLLIFVFINTSQDYGLYLLIYSGGNVFVGAASLILVFLIFHTSLKIPDFTNIKEQFIEGWYLFLSTFSISLYTTTNTFILGLFAPKDIVGYFSAADKIRYSIQGFFSSIGQAAYPHTALLVKESKEKALHFLKKLLKIVFYLGLVISILTFIFSYNIVVVVLGERYINSLNLLRILSFMPFIIIIGNIAGVQTLLNFGYQKTFTKIIILAGIINLILSVIFIPVFKATGTVIIMNLIELFVTMMFYYKLKKHNLKII